MAAELAQRSNSQTRILLLEDSEIDAELATTHLAKAGTASVVQRVATRDEFMREIGTGNYDVVLADYSLPDFDGIAALDIVREHCPDMPFIFVSGVVGEEFAINALRRGATDYVMKRGLSRLPAAVDRAVAEARERQDRVRAEQALRISETSAQLAIETAGLGRWALDPATGIFDLDARCRELFGLTANVTADRETFLKYCHNSDRPRIEATLRATLAAPNASNISTEFRIVRAGDVQERWVSLSGRAFRDGGECTRLIGIVNDITERKQAEAELQDLNQTLTLRVAHKTAERDHLWQLSKDLMAVMTPVGALIEVNPAWQTSFGHGTSEVVGEHLSKFAHPEDAASVREAMAHASQDSQRPFECRFLCRDGKTRWVSWSIALGHGYIYAVGRDITEDKAAQARLEEAQEALRQSQKMEAVGQLTGGMAHDFNNLLQVVVGNIETLQRKLPPNLERLRRAADHAMAGAQRATNLTQHLLAFSRKQPLNPRPVAVNRLVAGMSEMLQRTLGELIQIETALSPDLRHVEIDGNQLEIALLNLAVNARDAMPDGGKLRIETFNLDLRSGAPTDNLPRGEYVALTVDDTGIGMPPEVLARAFEPFFTTKNVGQGTGLGLSQVYGFVRQSGGQVRIHSADGAGTSICMYLPAARPDARLPEEETQHEMPLLAERETILVVEDDPDVRAFTVETVRELGYDVLEARDGSNALNLLRQTPAGDIDLLFSDVVLPGGMNGQQLAQQAVILHPRLKVLFATGYARDVIVHHGRLDPGVQLITKPFAFDDLAARIRSVLDDQDSARHAN
ncbi:response regulator [Steroidobacter sp.]|uniref:response regulator n=1 Tax=Steroidobacter sp. TaxID=1978227 RepID=UPI001A3E7067|nr:response regulator [Steroidobacter sp.]MBL8265565.1 response regulator [Steroidobacter sp.]